MKLFKKALDIYALSAVLLVPLVFLRHSEDAYFLPKLALMAPLSACAVYYIFSLGNRAALDAADYSLLGFLFFLLPGFIRSNEISTAVISYLEWVLCASGYFYVKYCTPPGFTARAIAMAMVSAFLTGLYAVMQTFGLDLSGWVTDFSGRAFSTFGNPDFLGGFLVFAAPLAAVFYFTKSGSGVISALLLIFICSVLILTQTRSSAAALCAALILMAFLLKNYFAASWKLFLILACCAAVLIAVSGKHGDIISRFRSSSSPADSGMSGRAVMWSAGLKAIGSNMLTGTGFGSTRNLFAQNNSSGRYFETDRYHNDFIEIASESGIISMLMFAAFCFFAARSALKGGDAGRAVFAAMAGLLIQAFFNFPFYIIPTKFYFFIFTAAVAQKPSAAHRVTNYIPVAAAVAIFLAAGIFRLTCGSIYLNDGINSTLGGDPAGAVAELERARSMYPFARVKYQLSVALRNAGKNEAAVGEINAYLKLRPLSKDGLTQAAILSAEAGRLDEALEYTGRLLDRYPAETDMLNNRAKILFVKGDTQGAVALYNKILAMEPDNKVAKDNLNAILYMVKSSNRNSRFEHSK